MDAFTGEIRIFTGNFTPIGWADCDGQLMQISQNTALFSVLLNVYGGDGNSTFALPNLMGRVPLKAGSGPGLSSYNLGQQGGEQMVSLVSQNLPPHNHGVMTASDAGDTNQPNENVIARSVGAAVYNDARTSVSLAGNALSSIGGSQAHNNMQPYLPLRFIVCLQGNYPQRQ